MPKGIPKNGLPRKRRKRNIEKRNGDVGENRENPQEQLQPSQEKDEPQNNELKRKEKAIPTLEDARKFYRKKIRDYIYVFTGCFESVSEKVVDDIEKRLIAYIQDIRDKTILCTLERTKKKNLNGKKLKMNFKKKENVKGSNLDDLYNALKGTADYYGARHCILLKLLGKKVQAQNDDVEVPVAEDDDLEEERDDSDIVQLQNEISSLDDGTAEYLKFKTDRFTSMKRADDLTFYMSQEDYLDYANFAKTKFIQQKDLYALWMNWTPSPSSDVFTALGWISGNKLRNILRKAIQKRTEEISSFVFSAKSNKNMENLFVPNLEMYDRMIPLQEQYFLNNKYYQKFKVEEFEMNFWKLDGKFRISTKNNEYFSEWLNRHSILREEKYLEKERMKTLPFIFQASFQNLLKKDTNVLEDFSYTPSQIMLHNQENIQEEKKMKIFKDFANQNLLQETLTSISIES